MEEAERPALMNGYDVTVDPVNGTRKKLFEVNVALQQKELSVSHLKKKRKDEKVIQEYEDHLSMLDCNPFEANDTGDTGLDSDVEVHSKTGVSRGRPSAMKPLHPGRIQSSAKTANLGQQKSQSIGQKSNHKQQIIEFSLKPGPKGERLGPLSLQKLGPKKLRASEANQRISNANAGSVFKSFSDGAEKDLDLDLEVEFEFHTFGTANSWLSNPVYWLRQDEADGLIDIAMAVAHAFKKRTIILNATSACGIGKGLLESGVDQTDVELGEIKPDMFKAENSAFSRVRWYTQELSPGYPSVWRFVLYDWTRPHWILVELYIEPEFKVVILDSLSNGSVDDIDDWYDRLSYMMALASHFTPGLTFPKLRLSKAVRQWRRNIEYRTLSIQNDGWACGFWTCTFSLLAACGVKIDDVTTNILSAIGIEPIKWHLVNIYNSFVLSQHGLESAPLQALLNCLGFELHVDEPIEGYVAVCPSWIKFEPVLPQKSILSEDPNTTRKERQPSESQSITPDPELPYKTHKLQVQMKPGSEALGFKSLETFQRFTGFQHDFESAKKVWEKEFEDMISKIKSGGSLDLKHAVVTASDLQRLAAPRFLNDEVIQAYIELFEYTLDNPGLEKGAPRRGLTAPYRSKPLGIIRVVKSRRSAPLTSAQIDLAKTIYESQPWPSPGVITEGHYRGSLPRVITEGHYRGSLPRVITEGHYRGSLPRDQLPRVITEGHYQGHKLQHKNVGRAPKKTKLKVS
ncbi:hypothetical protein K435DRAFT_796021 [Dendrothele bispora CBS 962.96]|uniref:Uncharacterized protein n=1 Tax=Dendrothele bispora (strain CBS 962.96) TaxID=1314807 RepID=A0A4S8M6U0_DENBC|nr:hypothetical protein K435DRAFT_796021 [Dendrothele bispora CBS 962.96]